MSAAFDLFTPEVVPNPYPLHHDLRAQAPVFHSPTGAWVLTRYEDLAAGLHDPRFSSESDLSRVQLYPVPLRETAARFLRSTSAMMVRRDPPAHTRLRALVTQALTPA